MDYPQAFVSIIMLCIFVVVGLPLWWNTTKVYRADLPHQQIAELKSSIKVLQIRLQIYTESEAASLMEETRLLQTKLNETFQYVQFEVHVTRLDVSSKETQNYCSLMNEKGVSLTYHIFLLQEKSIIKSTTKYCRDGLKLIISTPENYTSLSEDIVACTRALLPVEEISSMPTLLTKKTWKSVRAKHTLQPSAGYRLTFNLAIANPLNFLPTWDIENAINKKLQPVLRKLEFMGPFHVSSQVLYFADVGITPYKDGNVFYVTKTKLPLFINPLESRLNTYTSTDANLNFIIYIPPNKYAPLVIKSKKSSNAHYTAFHSPRWGGIQIYNPSNASLLDGKFTVPIEELMKVFIVQLRNLLGITVPEDLLTDELSDFVRMKLLVYKTFEHLRESISTLTSLSKLLDEIANIVIRDDIKELIETSVKNIESAVTALKHGLISKAYTHSKTAFVTSEKAFYDASLLALLYFPDDQKYAIYVPLFLPIALPVLLSFGKAINWLKNSPAADSKIKSE